VYVILIPVQRTEFERKGRERRESRTDEWRSD